MPQGGSFGYTVRRIQGDWLWVGTGWLRSGDVLTADEALAWFTAELEKRPTPFAYISRAEIWLGRDDPDKAIEDCNEAIRLDANCHAAWRYRAVAYRRNGDLEHAASDLETAIRLRPQEASNYRQRSLLNNERQDYQAMLEDARRAIQLDPTDAYGFEYAAFAREGLHDVRGAIDELSRAVALDPDYANSCTSPSAPYPFSPVRFSPSFECKATGCG